VSLDTIKGKEEKGTKGRMGDRFGSLLRTTDRDKERKREWPKQVDREQR